MGTVRFIMERLVSRYFGYVRTMLRRIVDESGVPQAQLAEDAGVSYASIRSWLIGRRTPEPDSLRKLAAGLRARAEKLRDLADEIEASFLD